MKSKNQVQKKWFPDYDQDSVEGIDLLYDASELKDVSVYLDSSYVNDPQASVKRLGTETDTGEIKKLEDALAIWRKIQPSVIPLEAGTELDRGDDRKVNIKKSMCDVVDVD